jgi:hypothetical protein
MVFPAEPCGIVSMFGWADIVKSGDVEAGITLAGLPDGTAKTNPVNSIRRKNTIIGVFKSHTLWRCTATGSVFEGLNVSLGTLNLGTRKLLSHNQLFQNLCVRA